MEEWKKSRIKPCFSVANWTMGEISTAARIFETDVQTLSHGYILVQYSSAFLIALSCVTVFRAGFETTAAPEEDEWEVYRRRKLGAASPTGDNGGPPSISANAGPRQARLLENERAEDPTDAHESFTSFRYFWIKKFNMQWLTRLVDGDPVIFSWGCFFCGCSKNYSSVCGERPMRFGWTAWMKYFLSQSTLGFPLQHFLQNVRWPLVVQRLIDWFSSVNFFTLKIFWLKIRKIWKWKSHSTIRRRLSNPFTLIWMVKKLSKPR